MLQAEKEIIQQYTAKPPVSVGGLARALGIDVKASSLRPNISGQIQPSELESDKFVIRINRHEPIERQRFTLAHEIAHFLLHRDRIGRGVFDTVLYRSNLHSRQESEANQLAAAIIMPLDPLKAEFAKLGGQLDEQTVEQLAAIFKVSKPAMRIRMEQL